MPGDWVRFENDFPDHDKWEPLSDAAFRLGVRLICWARQRPEGGGFIPEANAKAKAGGGKRATRLIGELVKAGAAMHEHGILEPREGGYQIHDFDQYGPPARVRPRTTGGGAVDPELSRKRAEAGRRGGKASGASRRENAMEVTEEQRKAAQLELQMAVKQGTVVRLPCAVCGATPAEGHHEDYSRPLDVVWLCRAHHHARHVELREQSRKAKRSKPDQQNEANPTSKTPPLPHTPSPHDTTNDQRSSCDAAAKDLSGGVDTSEANPAAAAAKSGSVSEECEESQARIPCPRDLRLTEGQIETLEVGGVPRWAVDQLTTKHVTKWLTMPRARWRPLEQWRGSLVTAVTGDWNDPARRPKKVGPALVPGRQPNNGMTGLEGAEIQHAGGQ